MEINTSSGVVRVVKRTPFCKWLVAYLGTGAFTGWSTLSDVWRVAADHKPYGVTWSAWGKLCGKVVSHGAGIGLMI